MPVLSLREKPLQLRGGEREEAEGAIGEAPLSEMDAGAVREADGDICGA